MKLTTKQIGRIVTILLEYAEQRGYNIVQFSNEDGYYQKIWHKDRDLNNPPKITIGILDEDMEALATLLEDETANAYDFERLGAVLTAFGATLVDKTFFNKEHPNNATEKP